MKPGDVVLLTAGPHAGEAGVIVSAHTTVSWLWGVQLADGTIVWEGDAFLAPRVEP